MEKIIPCDLGPEHDAIEIYPINDVHLGDLACEQKKFEKFLDYILEKPNRYVILNGDIINNNLKSSVGSVYDDTMRPKEQKKLAKKLLWKIRRRILSAVDGNHEWRSKKETDESITEDIAEYLGVPYSDDSAVLKVTFGRKRNSKRQCYTIFHRHTLGGGRKSGSSLNQAEEEALNIACDIFIFGHVHRKISSKNEFVIPDTKNNVLRTITQLFVIAPSWQSYASYAKIKGLKRQVTGSVPIILYAREKEAYAVI